METITKAALGREKNVGDTGEKGRGEGGSGKKVNTVDEAFTSDLLTGLR